MMLQDVVILDKKVNQCIAVQSSRPGLQWLQAKKVNTEQKVYDASMIIRQRQPQIEAALGLKRPEVQIQSGRRGLSRAIAPRKIMD